MKIKCSTLFDITKTNVSTRRGLLENEKENTYEKQRNQQSNFETIIQVISLRSQPEDISETSKESINTKKDIRWGKKYSSSEPINCWSFNFTVHHAAVFSDLNGELGNLLLDCDGVPMIIHLDEFHKLEPQLNTSGNLKNIHFEIINEITTI